MFIDYVVNVSIVKQIILSFNNIDKLNFRLVRAFTYLFQFRFDIRYCFDKRYVISNVLFKLSINRFFLNEKKKLNLKNYHNNLKNFFVDNNNQHFVYRKTLIDMSTTFYEQIIAGYAKKKA